jgi:UDP-3-O-[3-hydroxymyristoyl] glucosamine N-acyltransferase
VICLIAVNYKIGPLAEKLGGKVHGNPDAVVHRLMPLETAQAGDLTFFAPTSKRSTAELREKLVRTNATAVLLAAVDEELGIVQISVPHPIAAVVHLADLFRPSPKVAPGIHPTAVISPSATLADGVAVGAFAVIGDDVQIGAGTVIHPHVVIYERIASSTPERSSAKMSSLGKTA